MRERLLLFWDAVRSSYWFVPALMMAGGVALAVALVALDGHVDADSLRGIWWVFGGGAEGARTLLSSVAGSIITVAGVTFSITISVLSSTSSQFGPRLLRGFLRDTGNQTVLGTFLATFLYCLLVLRTVRSVEEVAFVPQIAVTGGVALALASVCMLVYFIHHVSHSIQANQIIANAAREMDQAIDRLFPEAIGEEADEPGDAAPPERWEDEARPVRAVRSGYVQAVEGDALLALARERDLRICLRHRPGRFVAENGTLALVRPPDGAEEAWADVEERVRDAFSLGDQRTTTQDVEFAVEQLVEVAVRALSPGINDPFTAMMCLDRLGAGLCRLAGRDLPAPLRHDEAGVPRILAEPVTFAGMAEAAFGAIRHYGKGDARVMARLLEVIGDAAECARTGGQRAVLREQAARTLEAARDAAPGKEDRALLQERHRAVLRALFPEKPLA